MQILRSAGCALVTILLIFLATWAYLRSGRLDVAAEQPQGDWQERTLRGVRESSLSRAASGIAAPEAFDAPTVARGALVYVDACEICHGGPGRQGLPFAYGMHPVPPTLDAPAIQDRSDGELFWITSKGIRFTGMPAFERLFDEEDRWAVVAFLRKLPNLMPDEYEAMVASYTEGGLEDAGEHGDHQLPAAAGTTP